MYVGMFSIPGYKLLQYYAPALFFHQYMCSIKIQSCIYINIKEFIYINIFRGYMNININIQAESTKNRVWAVLFCGSNTDPSVSFYGINCHLKQSIGIYIYIYIYIYMFIWID
jgi:hypothetical protein